MRTILFAGLGMAVLLAACSKQDPPTGPATAPKVYHAPKGIPTGVVTSKTIGASGGTISTPDNLLTVTVPAGAVSSNTEFSIQPITNTTPNGIGAAYRLLPEGLHFAQPVTIAFQYNDDLIEGTVPEELSIAYQDGEGVWQAQKTATLNTTTKTVSVTSTHFSDWAALAYVRMTVDKPSIDVNEQSNLAVMEIAPSIVSSLDNNIALDTTAVKDIDVEWSKNSTGGLLISTTDIAEYTAPPTVPSPNPITVTAKVTHKSGATKTLTRKIYVGKPFLEVVYNNITNIYPNAEFYAGANDMHLSAANTVGNGGSIIFSGAGAGTYPFGGASGSGSMLNLIIGGLVIKDAYMDCSRHMHQLDGEVKITTFGAVNQYVEGTFSGYVTLQNSCSPAIEPITGRFRAKRMQ